MMRRKAEEIISRADGAESARATKKTAVPRLRFKGCEGAWEEKSLCGFVSINPRANIPEQFEYVDLESVLGTKMISHRTENRTTAPSRAQRLASIGDIFFQTVRPYQKNNLYFDVENQAYVFSTGYAQLRPNVNGKVLFNAIQSDAFVHRVLLYCTGSSYPAINPTVLGRILLSMPKDRDEAVYIGRMFDCIDTSINQGVARLSSLLQLKRAMLVKMFPRPGQSVPEIRFKGFEGKWKEDLAGRIFQTVNIRNRAELPVLSASQEWGMIFRDDGGMQISHNRANEKTYKLVSPGDFVIHLRSFQGGFAHSTISGIASPAYTILHFHDELMHDDFFWRYVFTSKAFVKRLELITYGIRDGRSINFLEFSVMSLMFPSLPEQRKIAAFFRNLDRLIGAAEKKVAKLRQVKASLLERMFV